MSRVVHVPARHESASAHVSGRALYLDDMPEPPGLLHGALVLSPHPHARIVSMDLSAARALPGVVAVAAGDVPGVNDIAPIRSGEPALAQGVVEYVGHPVAAVAAPTLDEARAAAALVKIEYEKLPALLLSLIHI